MQKTRSFKILLLITLLQIDFVLAEGNTDKSHCLLSGTLDSGFFGDITTNRARLKFANNIEDINSCVFNKVDSWLNDDMAESYSSRTLTFALGGFLNYYSHYALEFTLHEFGHRGRDIATGEYFEWSDRSEVPHIFYLQTLLTPAIHTSDELGDDENYNIKFQIPTSLRFDYIKWETNAIAAGFTADTKLSGLIADRMYYGKSKPTDFFAYTHDKLFPAMYDLWFDSIADDIDGGDVADLARQYQIQGWDISTNDIVNASLISYLLSASTYAYIVGVNSYISSGNRSPKSFEFHGFRLPDVQAFYEQGISYKIISGYRVNSKLDIPFTFEQVVKGNKQQEYSIGLNYQLNERYKFKGQYLFGKKSQGKISLSTNITSHISVYFGVEFNDINNLEGMRNISSLENGPSDTELFFGIDVYL